MHPQISSLREFVETFAYQFTKGANAERVSGSKELFDLFYDTLKNSELDQREELGGHSPVWALRSQRENCKVFISAQTTSVTSSQLHYRNGEPVDGDFKN